MVNYNRLAEKLKEGLSGFSQKISKGMKCPVKKFILQMLYSDITKPCSKKMEALSDVRDVSTGEIKKGYLTDENLKCLHYLSANFGKTCVRTLDRGFDAKDYYRYFLDRDEKFIICVKKNRNIIYKNKTCNIMDVAKNYKGNYCMGFMDKHGKKIQCKTSYIPVKLCAFPQKNLVLVAVYGFGKNPMLLLTNMGIQETSQKKKLCIIVTKVYLMGWRTEEYFRFKNQQFNFEDLRVMLLNPIHNLNFLQHWQLVIWEYFILKIVEARLWTGYLNVQKEYIKSPNLFFTQ